MVPFFLENAQHVQHRPSECSHERTAPFQTKKAAWNRNDHGVTHAPDFRALFESAPALDLKMPELDALDVLRQMKADEGLRAIPVAILASLREEKDPVESYRLGVNACVVKRVDFSAFIDAVKQLGGFWAVINEPPRERLPAGAK